MRRLLCLVAVAMSCSGCAAGLAALEAISAASQGAQWLGSVLDVAEDGSAAYFARHPSLERQQAVGEALTAAKRALAAYDAAAAAVSEADRGNVGAARAAALKAYQELRALLDSMGILEGRAPEGGAETDAPMPGALELPTAAEMGAES
jgi:hypothetical protein